jgi:CubicO group peptidase (beta-lactamase class C family)
MFFVKINTVLDLTLLLLCTIGSLLSAKYLQAQVSEPDHAANTLRDTRSQKLISMIQAEMQGQNVHGMAVAIVQNGKVVFQQGFGVRDTETKAPITPQTLFRIGSTTKPLTVIALMRLVEAGQLDLDAPVINYLPQFKVNPKITVRQLLSHTAGLADAAEPFGRTDPAALRESIERLNPQSAFTSPGTVFSYANPGFNTAGAILEAITGEFYPRYMEEQIFPILGMTRTLFNPSLALTYPVAIGHQPTSKGMEVVRPTPDNAAEAPAGLAYSSAQDLSKLLLFLLQNGQVQGKSILSTRSVQMMKNPVLGHPPLKLSYGLGLAISERDGVRMIGHGGEITGFSTTLETFPEYNLGIVILTNRSGFDPTTILATVRQAWLNLPEPVKQPPIQLDEQALKAYVGQYRLSTATNPSVGTLTVSLEKGKLNAKVEGQPTVELVPLSPNVFELYVPEQPLRPVTFLRDKTGRVVFFVQGLRAFARLKS